MILTSHLNNNIIKWNLTLDNIKSQVAEYKVMWPQQAQAQVHQQAQAHIKAQSLEAWWERFTWASHKMIKSIIGFLHYLHGLKKSLKYEMMHEGSSLDLNWAIV